MIDLTINDVNPQDIKGGFAIQDPEITQYLSDKLSAYDWNSFLVNDGKLSDTQEEYKSTFRHWIENSKNNTINLGPFTHTTITNGTSEAFQMFMQRHSHRTFRFRAGEFMMHKVTANNMNLDWSWIHNYHSPEEYTPHDALIISVPYSNSCSHESVDQLKSMLVHCNKLKIPVLLDFAYFGTTTDLHVDLSDSIYDCVEDVSFSLGKTYPLIGARPGIRFQRKLTDDAVFFANQNGIVNNFACVSGILAMNKFDADYIYNKYHERAEDIAYILNATVSCSTIFLTSMDTKWNSINRVEHEQTRLCISNLLTRT